jgi:hypothetical protein
VLSTRALKIRHSDVQCALKIEKADIGAVRGQLLKAEHRVISNAPMEIVAHMKQPAANPGRGLEGGGVTQVASLQDRRLSDRLMVQAAN